MIDRDSIIKQAHHDCMRELYAKAQPSANYDELIEGVKNGTIEDSSKNPLYERYYLSYEEFFYILNKYCKAYGIEESWQDNLDIVRNYFAGEGYEDVFVEGRIDEEGYKHPGYRSAKQVPHIKNAIANKYGEDIASDISDMIFAYIDKCKDYYRFDREESNFRASIALGASPTSNKQTVIDYWKNKGVEVVIEDRNPLLFWEKDYYEDEFEEMMLDEYGDNWEEETWKQYYNSPEGKKKLVENFISTNKNTIEELDKCFVEKIGDEMFVCNINDLTSIHIDIFIEKYNICYV